MTRTPASPPSISLNLPAMHLTLAGDGGLEGCALGKVAEGEDGYSQSGFPAVAGTVSAADSAAAFESALGDEFASIEVVGESGNDLVPMTEYRYEFEVEGGRVPGIAHVFSGQGMIWALDCAGLEPAEAVSSDLAADCDRAVETLGFLMF